MTTSIHKSRLMRSLLLFGLALLAGAALTACETVVEVDPPSHEPTLVAQGFFSPDSLWVVQVSHTVPYTSAEAPQPIENATVEIWADSQLIARPVRSDTGTYAATGVGAVQGQTYTLKASAPGYTPTEGHDILPPPPPIVSVQETQIEPTDSTSRRRLTQVDITLNDPAGEANYYGLLVVQVRWREDRQTGQVTPLPPSLFIFESNDIAFGESEFDFLDTDKTVYREAFFTDGLFNGSTYTLDFDVQYDEPSPDASIAVQRALGVVLLSVTEDFYRYWETASDQILVNDNPFAEPLRVHSNMTNGFGVFAGFQYRIIPLEADRLGLNGFRIGDLCALLGSRLPGCSIVVVPNS